MNKINTLTFTAVLGLLCACQGGSFADDKSTADSTAVDSALHIAVVLTHEADKLLEAKEAGLFDDIGIEVKIDTFMSAMDADTAFLKGHAHLLLTDSVKVEHLKKEMEKPAQGAGTPNRAESRKPAQGAGAPDRETGKMPAPSAGTPNKAESKKPAQSAGKPNKEKNSAEGKRDSIIVLHTDTLTLSLITAKSARIKNIKSLKDKIIAVTRNSAVDATADLIMKKAQMPAEALNRPQINDVKLRAEMLNLGQYDGAILPEPYATICVDSGGNRVFTNKRLWAQLVAKSSDMKKFGKEIEKIVGKLKVKSEKGEVRSEK
ncbi:MAG: hypothetical protein KBS99_02315 [Prevotellaceae bacterium]|nr:hypothetical protein [Candidatus Colivivens caballi]